MFEHLQQKKNRRHNLQHQVFNDVVSSLFAFVRELLFVCVGTNSCHCQRSAVRWSRQLFERCVRHAVVLLSPRCCSAHSLPPHQWASVCPTPNLPAPSASATTASRASAAKVVRARCCPTKKSRRLWPAASLNSMLLCVWTCEFGSSALVVSAVRRYLQRCADDAHPSPPVDWRNRERKRFFVFVLQRARCVLRRTCSKASNARLTERRGQNSFQVTSFENGDTVEVLLGTKYAFLARSGACCCVCVWLCLCWTVFVCVYVFRYFFLCTLRS